MLSESDTDEQVIFGGREKGVAIAEIMLGLTGIVFRGGESLLVLFPCSCILAAGAVSFLTKGRKYRLANAVLAIVLLIYTLAIVAWLFVLVS